MNQAKVTNLVSQLKYKIEPKHRRLSQPDGPAGRVRKIQKTLTALMKFERLELNYNRADESRGYVDRLISEAIRHGPGHQETMEMADYWILEKQYIHKLFKVLVPRFHDYHSSYTRLHKIQRNYPGTWRERAVLELRGNPYPSLEYPTQFHSRLIQNVLLDEARKEYRLQKYKELSANLTE